MTAPSTLQLNIHNGDASQEGPFARTVPLSDGGECLLLVAEAHGPDGAEVCDNALEYLTQVFLRGNLSVSRRLLDGLKGIHQGLAADNRRSLPQHRVTLGAVVAFARGEDLYLAQAGGAAAHLIDEAGGHELTPAPAEGVSEPLGGPRPPQLVVRRVRLRPGQRVVLLAGGAAVPCDQALVGPFQQGLEEGMAALYRRSRSARSLGALALELPDERPRRRQAVRYGASLRPAERRPAPAPAPEEEAPMAGVEPATRPVAIPLRPPPVRAPNPLAGLVPPRALALLAVAFVVMGLASGAGWVMDRLAQQAQEQAQAVLRTAQDLEARAAEAPTQSLKRDLLTEAANQLQDLVRRSPGDPEGEAALARVRAQLTALDAIVPLQDVRTVADFAQSIGGNLLTRDLVATPRGLMVLDRGGDRVLLVAPANQQGDGQRQVSVFAQSSARGRRNLGHLAWLPRGGAWPRDSLLTLDESRALLELTADAEPRQLALRGAAEWESVQALVGYNGVLYVLDPKASQVWRYPPTDNGFDSNRQPALPALDVRDGVDLAVDGDFYVLLRDGRVLKVSGGRPVPFAQDGLDKPLLNPVAMATAPDLPSLYVIDQGNRRVVEFEKATGRFLRQYPLGGLPQAHDLWVDGARNTLYLVSDRALHAATLPGG